MQHPGSLFTQSLQICRSDRWLIHQRLTELGISSVCLPNGDFQVEMTSLTTLLQLRSVLQQLTAPRSQLTGWLERCWQQS